MSFWDEESSDVELVDAARSGDREAYGELFRRHRRMAFAHARQLAGDDMLAGDLVSEAFIKVLNQLDRGLGPSAGFGAYLATTIRNLYIDGYRRDKKQLLVAEVSDVVKDDQSVVPDPTSQLAEASTILGAFSAIPEGWREILWRIEVLGQPHADVAESMGMTPNAVGVAVFRAREGLREAYIAQHLRKTSEEACRQAAHHIPRYVRGKLGSRKALRLDEHLGTCEFCRSAVADVQQINTNLSGLLVPALASSFVVPKISTGSSAAAVVSARTVGIMAGFVAALVLLVASDRQDATPVAAADERVTVSPVETRPTEDATPEVEPTERPTRRATPADPEPSQSQYTAEPESEAPTVRPEPKPSPVPSSPVPTPTTVRPVSLGAPSVTVARSSAVTLVRVEQQVLNADGRRVSLFVDATNVNAMTPDAGWTCDTPTFSGANGRIRCSRTITGMDTFAVTLQVVDTSRTITGQIGLSDQTQVMSFVSAVS